MDQRYRIVKTAFYISTWICMGLFSEVSSPTLPYLKDRVGADYEQIARPLVARSVGFLLGSLGAGIIGSGWKHLLDLWLALALLLAGGATIVAPWCHSLALLAVMFSLDGAGKGVIAVTASTAIMIMWKDKAATPTHALHFSFGIGALLAPLIARPFLPATPAGHGNKLQPGNSNSPVDNTTFSPAVYSTDGSLVNRTVEHVVESAVAEEARLEILYAIMGGITSLVGLCFIYFQLNSRCRVLPDTTATTTPGRKKESDEGAVWWRRLLSAACGPRRCRRRWGSWRWQGVVLILLLGVFWCLPVGAERAFGKFLFAFAVESDLQMAPRTASLLESVFWVSFTAGRGLATLVSRWTPPQVLLAAEIVVKIACTFVLTFTADRNVVSLWVAGSLFGATISPIFPAAMIWVNLYIEMNAMMNAFAFLSSACGAFIFSWGAGYLFQYEGPIYLMYLMLGYAVAVLVLFFFILTHLRLGKFKKRGTEEEEEEDTSARV